MAVENSNDALQAEIGITLNKLTKQLAVAEARMVKTATNMEKKFANTNRAVVSGFAKSNRAAMGFAKGGLRNAMMQFNQMAQSGMVTGDWVKSVAIQLPDLALAFGTAGAAAGVLLGVLGPMAIEMVKGTDSAKELEGQLKSLEAAMQRLEAAQANSSMSIVDQFDEYQGLTEQARQLFEIERQIAEIRAQAAVDDAARGIARGLGIDNVFEFNGEEVRKLEETISDLKAGWRDLQGQFFAPGTEEYEAWARQGQEIKRQLDLLKDVRKNLDDLGDSLGISEAQAQEVAARFAEFGEAEGPREQADAMISLAGYINEVSDNLTEAEDEGQALYDALLEASAKLLEIAGIDAASNVGATADEADRLADNLTEAANIWAQLSAEFAAKPGAVQGGRGGDPRQFEDDPYWLERRFPKPLEYQRKKKKRKSGGKSEQEKELNRLMREREQILKGLESAQDRYAQGLSDLNALKAMGKLTTEQYDAALKKLNQDLASAEYATVINGIESVSQGVADAILEAENMGDVFAGVLKQMARDILASNIKDLLLDLIPSGGSGGGIFKSIIKALTGARAAGGPMVAGGVYKVNENTPNSEYFVPGQSGRIMTSSQVQRSVGSGVSRGVQADVRVHGGNLTLTDSGEITTAIRISSMRAQAGAVQNIKDNWGGYGAQYNAEGVIS